MRFANPVTVLCFTAAMTTGAIPAGTGTMVVAGVFVGSAVWWATHLRSPSPHRATTRLGTG
ncbi:MAG: hypothetical protein M3P34_10325 [Actinomycetota bacterium]|nr:hypothetical protein [Actinomycetota bacterium]